MLRSTVHASCSAMPGLVLPAGMTSDALPVGLEFDMLPDQDRELLSLGLPWNGLLVRSTSPQ